MSRENIFMQALKNLSLEERQAFLDESSLWLTTLVPSSENERLFIEAFLPYLNQIYHEATIPTQWLTVVFTLYRLQPLFFQWIRRIPQPRGTVNS